MPQSLFVTHSSLAIITVISNLLFLNNLRLRNEALCLAAIDYGCVRPKTSKAKYSYIE